MRSISAPAVPGKLPSKRQRDGCCCKAADDYVKQRLEHYGFHVLPIELRHVLQIYKLPPLHHDPFDRLLVAQSQVEKLPLISGDSEIARYAVDIIW